MNKSKTIKILGISLLATLAFSTLLSASASLDNGRFFIHAYDSDEPKFQATAGVKGEKTTNPGGGNSDNKILASYSCGSETLNYTQSMKDLTEANLALHEQGRDAEMERGPGDWEAVKIVDVAPLGGTLVLVGDVSLAKFSDSYSTVESASAMIQQLEPDQIYGQTIGFSDPSGRNRFGISYGIGAMTSAFTHSNDSIALGLFTPDGCTYSKTNKDGNLSSTTGPAEYGETPNIAEGVTKYEIWAKDGYFSRDQNLPQISVALKASRIAEGQQYAGELIHGDLRVEYYFEDMVVQAKGNVSTEDHPYLEEKRIPLS